MPIAIDEAPWSGPSQLVVAVDIGTTYSSVGLIVLGRNSDAKPTTDRVTHWPSRIGLGGSSEAKTPSILYYDSQNQVKASGAAAATPTMRLAASKNGWKLVRYFKLLMHPPEMIRDQRFEHVEGLPQGLTVEKVYADMMKYLLGHTKDFFDQRYGSGKWERLAPTTKLVITHPNGWGLKQQKNLRYAVGLSEFMNEADTQHRVFFVPEAEASLHYVLWERSQELQPGDELIICDAGGSTVDTTAYRVFHENEATLEVGHNVSREKDSFMRRLFSTTGLTRLNRQSVALSQLPAVKPKAPICLQELKASDCRPAGGVLVNETFIKYLKDQLSTLPPEHGYSLELCIQKAEESFESNCKREFQVSADAPSEHVVEISVAISELGYSDGNIVLQRDVVKSFFDDAVRLILKSIRKQLRGTEARYIFLVGGFGASQYLRQRVTNEFQRPNLQVMFLDDAHGKAASDGSIIWFIRQRVVQRAARMSFGLRTAEPYDPSLSSHQLRQPSLYPSGEYYVSGKWDEILRSGSIVDQRMAHHKKYMRTYTTSDPELGSFSVNLYAWTSDQVSAPEWVTDTKGDLVDGFDVICSITGDLNGMRGSLRKQKGKQGTYYQLDFNLCLELGGVELKAFLEWKEQNYKAERNEHRSYVTDPFSLLNI